MTAKKFINFALVAIVAALVAVGASGVQAGGGSLGRQDAGKIFAACKSTAGMTGSPLRGGGKTTKMWCAVIDREGSLLLIESTDTNGTPENPRGSDAWRGSIEIAEAKAYTALAFSSNDLPLDSKTIGLLTRPDGPGLTAPPSVIGTNAGVAPLWGLATPTRSGFWRAGPVVTRSASVIMGL